MRTHVDTRPRRQLRRRAGLGLACVTWASAAGALMRSAAPQYLQNSLSAGTLRPQAGHRLVSMFRTSIPNFARLGPIAASCHQAIALASRHIASVLSGPIGSTEADGASERAPPRRRMQQSLSR